MIAGIEPFGRTMGYLTASFETTPTFSAFVIFFIMVCEGSLGKVLLLYYALPYDTVRLHHFFNGVVNYDVTVLLYVYEILIGSKYNNITT